MKLKIALDYVISNWVIGEKVYNECEKNYYKKEIVCTKAVLQSYIICAIEKYVIIIVV